MLGPRRLPESSGSSGGRVGGHCKQVIVSREAIRRPLCGRAGTLPGRARMCRWRYAGGVLRGCRGGAGAARMLRSSMPFRDAGAPEAAVLRGCRGRYGRGAGGISVRSARHRGRASYLVGAARCAEQVRCRYLRRGRTSRRRVQLPGRFVLAQVGRRAFGARKPPALKRRRGRRTAGFRLRVGWKRRGGLKRSMVKWTLTLTPTALTGIASTACLRTWVCDLGLELQRDFNASRIAACFPGGPAVRCGVRNLFDCSCEARAGLRHEPRGQGLLVPRRDGA